MNRNNNLIKCEICGRTFEKTGNNQKYCSPGCYKESNRINTRSKYHKKNPKYEHICPICHKVFTPEHSGEKYCSDNCKHEARRLNGRRLYLLKVMDADYHFDKYTVKFDKDDGSIIILKNGEFVTANPHDLFNAWNDLIGDYVADSEKELWKSIRRSKEFEKLQDHILKMKYVLLPELKNIEEKLHL